MKYEIGTKVILSGLILAQIAGCASIGSKERSQAVLIRSNPEGARIIVGGQVVGRTPQLVRVRRSLWPKVKLMTERGPVDVPLKTDYRWTETFFPNLIFLTYAPIGWLVDLAMGTAWQIQDSSTIPVELSKDEIERAKTTATPRKIAIAPPLAPTLSLSDTGGRALARHLRKRQEKFSVLPYEKTLEVFTSHSYDFDGRAKPADVNDLHYHVGTNEIFESEIEVTESGAILQGQIKNLVSKESSQPIQLRLESSDAVEEIVASKRWWYLTVPNSLGIDFANETLGVMHQRQRYELTPVGNDHWWSEGFKYLSSLYVMSMPQRRLNRASKWEFGFVPALRVSRRQVKAVDVPTLTNGDHEYTRWWVSAGYGPQIGYQVGRHFLYFNWVPYLYWSEVSWNQSNIRRSESSTGFDSQAELGYVFSMNKNWHLRFYSRSQMEDAEIWTRALQEIFPNSDDPLEVSTVTVGFAIGYTFEAPVDRMLGLK